MRNLLIVGLLSLGSIGIVTTGCTSAQIQVVEADLVRALQVSVSALDQVSNNPQAISQAEAALNNLAAMLPQSGPVHQAVVTAQSALAALKDKQATVVDVRIALQTVIDLLENQQKIPAGAVRHVAPVSSK